MKKGEDMTGDLLASASEAKPGMAETETKTVNNGHHQNPSTAITTCEQRKVKKRGSFNLFKAAVYMVTRKSGNNPNKKPSKEIARIESPSPKQQQRRQQLQQVPSSKGDNWKKLVGSIRPLHVPDNKSPTISPSPTVENFEELINGDSSRSFPSPSRYEVSSSCSMSQYASANNLQELDVVDNNSTTPEEKDEDPDEVFDAITGDEMIDAKAELFISQFYQQMKLQKNI